MQRIIKGTTQKAQLSVTNFGAYSLKDSELSIEIFVPGKRPTEDEDKVIITKEEMTFKEDDNNPIIVFDTAKLPNGTLTAELTVEYTDEDTGKPMKQIINCTFLNENGREDTYSVITNI